MFGNTSTTSGGLFGLGGNASTGGLFGAKPAAGGNSFSFGGSTGANTGTSTGANTGTGTTGGLFGQNNNTSTSTGGLFGGGNNNLANSGPTGNSFGAAPSNSFGTTNTFGGAAPTNSFGSSTPTNSFGQAAPSNSFGSTAPNSFGNNRAAPTGGLFNKPSTGLFGGQTPNQFGSSNQSGGTSNQFGGNTGSQFGGGSSQTAQSGNQFGGGLFGQNPQNNQQGQNGQNNLTNQQGQNNLTNQPSFNWSSQKQIIPTVTTTNTSTQPLTYTPAINDQLLKIKEQWDPNSSKCSLKTHFYNKFNDQEINILLNQQRPANESPEDWDQAMDKRPTANHYPIKITSFSEVAQRIETQLDYVAKSRILLNTINEKVDGLSSKHDLDNTTRILKAKSKHTQLSRRLLRLATVLAILKLKGYPLLPEEEEISKQFELLNAKLNDPNNPIGKLNDVFARLAILKERAEDLNYQFDNSINSLSGEDEEKVEGGNNEEIIGKLAKVLMKQQVGLSYLNGVLEKDCEKVATFT